MLTIQRGYMAKKKQPPAVLQANPTPERMKKAGADVQFGDDGHGHRVMTVRDAPIERALARNSISSSQYQAAQKYRHHWYRAGMAGTIGSSDMARVFGDGFRQLEPSEAATFHGERYAEAVKHIGKIGSSVLDNIVCRELSLEAVGQMLGWDHKGSAIVAATQSLREALDRLCGLWGMR